MGFATPLCLSSLTLITVIIASDVVDSTSNSAATVSQYQPDPNTYVVNAADYQSLDNAQTNSGDIPVLSLSQSIRGKAKARSTRKSRRKTKKNKKPRARTRPGKGVTASAASSGALVIASSSNGKRCVTIKKPCGTTCSSNSKSVGLCSIGSKPKYCFKTKKLRVACPGHKVKMCTSTEKVPDVCEKKVQKKSRCPEKVGKRTVCAYPEVPTYSCSKLPSQCAKLEKKKCRYRTDHQKFPCRKPKRPCRECFNNTAFKKCKATVTQRVEVPCDTSEAAGATASIAPRPVTTTAAPNLRSGANNTPIPATGTPSATPSVSTFKEVDFFDDQGGYDDSFGGDFDEFNSSGDFDEFNGGEDFGESSAIPINFGGAQEQTRSVACFASLFDDCDRAPPFCQLFEDSFDSDRCTREVCRECGLVKNMPVGRELKTYCQDLSASCHFFSRMLVTQTMSTAAVARNTVEKSGQAKKCYRNESKTVVVPCNYRLPKSEVCILGCRIGRCEKVEKKRVSKHCRGHLPKKCYQKCKSKKVKKKVCHTLVEREPSKKVCKKETKVKYRCYKKKTVKKPCKQQTSKLCDKLKKLRYICGKVASKIGKCTGGKGERKCKTKMCVQKKCS